MERDPLRQKIKDLLWRRGLTMKEASDAIGRSPSYMHQFLERGTPSTLNYGDSEKLAGLLGCDAGELRPAEAPRRKPQKRRRRTPPAALPGAPLAAIPEMAVEAAAGAGAAGEEFATEKARWYLPEGMIRHEGDAEPGNLRVLRARGRLHGAPRLRRRPAAGRRYPPRPRQPARWRCCGTAPASWSSGWRSCPTPTPPRLRLISANPAYEPYTCLAQDAHIVGKVLWTLRRM